MQASSIGAYVSGLMEGVVVETEMPALTNHGIPKNCPFNARSARRSCCGYHNYVEQWKLVKLLRLVKNRWPETSAIFL